MRSASCGNSFSTSSKSQRCPGPLLGDARAARQHARRQQQVLAHAERAEDAPALRHDRDAGLGDGVGRLAAQRAAAKTISPRAAASARPPSGSASSCPCRCGRGWRRSALAQRQADALQHVAVAVVGVDVGDRRAAGRLDMAEIHVADFGIGCTSAACPRAITRPRCITVTRSASAERHVHVVLDHHQRDVARQRPTMLKMRCRSLGERPAQGSSSNSTLGSVLSASASSSWRRSP